MCGALFHCARGPVINGSPLHPEHAREEGVRVARLVDDLARGLARAMAGTRLRQEQDDV